MTFENLKKILADFSDVKEEDIQLNDLLKNDLGLCSYDFMAILVLIEETIGKNIIIPNVSLNLSVQELLSIINDDNL